jgi:hypothetical protein
MDSDKCEKCGAELTDSHQCGPLAAPQLPDTPSALAGQLSNAAPSLGILPVAGPSPAATLAASKGSHKKRRNKGSRGSVKNIIADFSAGFEGANIGTVIVGGTSESKPEGSSDEDPTGQEEASIPNNSLFDLTEPLGMEKYELPADVAQSVESLILPRGDS